jgi:WD40 repeat protein
MKMPLEAPLPMLGRNNLNALPTWEEAISRFKKLQKLKPALSERRIKSLALLWLAFQHARAREIAEFPLFIRPQVSGEENNDLVSLLQNEITQTPERAWLIEGDAGMGKTTFCHYLCDKSWETFLAGDSDRVPLYIYLLDDIKQFDKTYLEAMIFWLKGRVWQDYLPEGITLDEADCAWLIQQPLLLILDGFDEVTTKKNYYHEYHWGDTSIYRDIKVIYGCRPEALALENRTELFGAPREKGKVPTYRGYLLEDLNLKQIDDYIEAYAKPERALTRLNATWYKGWLEKLPGLVEVVKVPQLLRIVLDIMPAIVQSFSKDANAIVQQHITRWRIYEEFVGHWIQEQAGRIRRDGHTKQGAVLYNLKGSLEGYLFSYISNLASTLWSDKEGHIDNRSLPSNDTLKPEFVEPRYRGPIQGGSEMGRAAEAEYRELLKFYQDNDKDVVFSNPEAIKIIRSGSLLKVDDQSHRFIHKTIIEYLTMGAMTYNLRNQFTQFMQSLDSVDINSKKRFDINLHPLRSEPDMIISFVEQFKKDKCFKGLLYEILFSSKTVVGLDYAASNAITLLNAMEENFSHLDLSDVQIPCADLRRSLCDCTNFRNANLTGVWFHGAWLRKATLTGANLQDIELGESNTLEHEYQVRKVGHYSESEDNSYWLVGCDDGYVYQWSNSTLIMVRKYNIGHSIFSKDQPVTDIAIHNESSLLLAKSRGNDITLWSLKTGTRRNTLKSTGQESVIAVSPNGKFIASGNVQGIRLWSVTSASCLRTFPSSKVFCFNAASDILAVVNDNATVSLWSMGTGLCQKTLVNNCRVPPSLLKFSPEGETLAAACNDGLITLWAIKSGYSALTLHGKALDVDYISFSHESSLLHVLYLSTSKKERFTILNTWHIPTKISKVDETFPFVVKCLCVNLSEMTVALSDDKSVYFESLDVRAKRHKNTDIRHALGSNDDVCDIAFDPKNIFFASWDQSYLIKLFRIDTGEDAHTFVGHTADVRGLEFSPDGKYLASWSIDGMIMLWSIKMLGKVTSYDARMGLMRAFEFSENSQLFATCDDNFGAKVWSVRGGCLLTIPGRFRQVKFLLNDSLIALNDAHERLIFWVIEKQEPILRTVHARKTFSYDYALSSDASLVAIKSNLGQIMIFSMWGSEYRVIWDVKGYRYAQGLRFSGDNKTLEMIAESKLIRVSIETASITTLKLSGDCPSDLNTEDNDFLLGNTYKESEATMLMKTGLWPKEVRVRIETCNINFQAHRNILLYGNTMLLVYVHRSFSLFDLNTGKQVLGLSLVEYISRIQWLETQSLVLITLGSINNIRPPP